MLDSGPSEGNIHRGDAPVAVIPFRGTLSAKVW
jgi:hypothetical protein